MTNTYTKIPQYTNLSRCEAIGRYIAETGDTVRGAAKHFRVSKSTVHKDITKTLKQENLTLYLQVAQILKIHKQERHIRGGLATKDKYLQLRMVKNNRTP